jgi:hypothetical protein
LLKASLLLWTVKTAKLTMLAIITKDVMTIIIFVPRGPKWGSLSRHLPIGVFGALNSTTTGSNAIRVNPACVYLIVP